MKYYIGSDHAGFALKEKLREYLKPEFELIDIGVFSEERADYPKIAFELAKKIYLENAMGILVCGTGIGMSIAANKIKGIRAAVIYDEFTAQMAREHNNANIACLGARNITEEKAIKITKIFLSTKFSGETETGKRHSERIRQIKEFEENALKK
ncbi:MAG: ribose 5-phosphate isomerase B [Candidatus ainarchaeum sp.]|nr:ribose 5-phosphate isomerase B [Candidatus ainarchaeum sp.]